MACKFLQAPARSGVSGQQRPRPGGLVAWVTIAAVQPSIPTALVIVGPEDSHDRDLRLCR